MAWLAWLRLQRSPCHSLDAARMRARARARAHTHTHTHTTRQPRASTRSTLVHVLPMRIRPVSLPNTTTHSITHSHTHTHTHTLHLLHTFINRRTCKNKFRWHITLSHTITHTYTHTMHLLPTYDALCGHVFGPPVEECGCRHLLPCVSTVLSNLLCTVWSIVYSRIDAYIYIYTK